MNDAINHDHCIPAIWGTSTHNHEGVRGAFLFPDEALKRPKSILLASIHKATPALDNRHCMVCGHPVKQVPGGHGPTWVHSDSGAVAAANPPSPLATAPKDDDDEQH